MSRRFGWIVAGCALSLGALAAPPPDLDEYVARAMTATGAPGLAVSIVENGETTFAKGYGVRKLGESTKADEHTLFPIGSNSKQFTATALALLVDEGKLGWDDKVAPRLPGFQMYDAYATGDMTVRDLLVHRSGLGLGAGDLMLFPRTNRTRQEVIEALRHLKPVRGFRAGYAYDNVLYLAAGQVIENVAHEPWDVFMRKRILSPLGMKDTLPKYGDLKSRGNFGWPHVREGGPNWAIGGTITPLKELLPVEDITAPAGGILASATDMPRWLAVQLARGALPGGKKRLFSEAQSRALWNPETLIPTRPPRTNALAVADPQFQAYALGFVVSDYRGHKVISHGGGVIGGVSETVLIPGKNVGFAIMTNSMEVVVTRSLKLRLLDHYLGFPATDWTTPMQELLQQMADQAAEAVKAMPVAAGGAPPSLPLPKYAGVYRDPWYGTVTIKEAGQGLTISFDRSPGMVGALEPVNHDTFRASWKNPAIEDAYATFTLKPDGAVDHFTMKAISPLADFSFDYQDLVLTPVPK
jgi:CubicO group peptidase (beta-lactamase class C family)